MQVVNEDVHGFNGDALHGQIPNQRVDVVSDDAGAAVVHGRTPLQLAVQPHKFIHEFRDCFGGWWKKSPFLLRQLNL